MKWSGALNMRFEEMGGRSRESFNFMFNYGALVNSGSGHLYDGLFIWRNPMKVS